MTVFYLIRHGETDWNVQGRFQGQQNPPLNATGETQARHVANALARYHFDAIYTSDLLRSVQTAEAIAQPHGIAPLPDPRLREVHFGAWEGFTVAEVAERWPEIQANWRADSLRTRPPDGETIEDLYARVVQLLPEIVERYPEGTVAIVAHGGPLRALITQALDATLSSFRHLSLDNCSISILRWQNTHSTLVRFNDVCHLTGDYRHPSWDEAGDQWRRALSSE
ncbi:MAG TPA: alpha-ribazole phosphatase [Armatimonadota bacterium]|jgi:alpha-ribazole phosphatase